MDLRKYLAPDLAVFPSLLDQVTDVCLVVDFEGRIRFANRAAEQVLGRPPDVLAGTTFLDLVHPDDRDALAELLLDVRAAPETRVRHPFRILVDAGPPHILESTWSTARRGEEHLLLVSAHDATERVRAQMNVRRREEELARAERVARLATWERNLTTNQFKASRQLMEIYGVARDASISFADLAQYVPAEDLAHVRSSMQKAQEALGAIAIDHRIHRPDGQQRIVHIRGQAELSGDDFVMFGTAQDVTELRTMEQALRASEQRFRAIFDSTFQFIGLMHPDGTMIEANATALAFAGITREDVIGRPFWECYWWQIGPAQQARLREAIRQAAGGAFVRYNTEVYGAGKRVTTIDFSIKPVLGVDGQVELLIPEGRDISAQIAHEQEIEQTNRRLRELTAQLHDAQEDERARIAREVHDVLGQALTSLRLDIRWLMDRLPDADDALTIRTAAALQLVEETLDAVRRISYTLRPGVLDHFGLPAAIEWLCEQQRLRSGIDFEVVDDTAGRLDDLEPRLAISLFRIFQEALTNILKHAGASRVTTRLAVKSGRLQMVIDDDGRGIRPEEIERSTSLGLLHMRERLLPWNGELSIHGVAAEGTHIAISVPLPVASRKH